MNIIMLSDRARKILDRIDVGKKLIDRHRPLPPSVLQRLHENLVIDWTYNSNAIEGNTLSINETRLVLQDGLTIGRKSVIEHLEAINHRDAIRFIETLARSPEPISERNIREIHAIVLKEIDPKYAGRYRDIQVRIAGSAHTPPDPLHLDRRVKKFVAEHVTLSGEHPVYRAAHAHFSLVEIHPFVDGNGRTARLLMNLILVKAGYFPAVILKNDRKKYYDSLERARRGNVDDFVILVARALERTLNLYFEAIPDLASNFLTLAEAAEESPYSKEYLNVLARRGGIPAFKIKRNWLVSRQALQGYVTSKKGGG
jgi:cell filamentation protein, protein adenylyltransferase